VLLGRIPHFEKMQFLETARDFEAAREAMSLTRTLKFKDRLMRELSGGERQLVFIARALAQEPRLLLLDEPTTHLDITHQVAILDLLKRLNRERGLTVIIVLHDLNLASEYCQRLVLMREGRIYKAGRPDEVLSYQIIEEVYKTVVVVEKNPISLRPYVLLVPEEERHKKYGEEK
jgi:iron complex transport system ATP-binding protein